MLSLDYSIQKNKIQNVPEKTSFITSSYIQQLSLWLLFKQVSSTGAAARDGRLQVGMRILEVNNHSLLGMTHTEAVRVLRAVGDSLGMLVCDGFDPRKVAAVEVRRREPSNLNKMCRLNVLIGSL